MADECKLKESVVEDQMDSLNDDLLFNVAEILQFAQELSPTK